jgi:hypothetical protein
VHAVALKEDTAIRSTRLVSKECQKQHCLIRTLRDTSSISKYEREYYVKNAYSGYVIAELPCYQCIIGPHLVGLHIVIWVLSAVCCIANSGVVKHHGFDKSRR